MSSAQAWAFVLSWMKMANAGRITRIQAEQMLDAYFARTEIAFANRYPKGD